MPRSSTLRNYLRPIVDQIVSTIQSSALDFEQESDVPVTADELMADPEWLIDQLGIELSLGRYSNPEINAIVEELMNFDPNFQQLSPNDWEKLHIFTPASIQGEAMSKQRKAKDEWPKKPGGWDKDSMAKYLKSLTGDRKHKITKCMKELKGAEWLDDPNDPGAFCASLVRTVEGETTEAAPLQTLQTQKKYVQEKGKGAPKQQQQKKDTGKKKGPGKFKKWLLQKMNFPEEEIKKMGRTEQKVLDLEDSQVLAALLKREAFLSEREEEKDTMRDRRIARRSRRTAAATTVRIEFPSSAQNDQAKAEYLAAIEEYLEEEFGAFSIGKLRGTGGSIQLPISFGDETEAERFIGVAEDLAREIGIHGVIVGIPSWTKPSADEEELQEAEWTYLYFSIQSDLGFAKEKRLLKVKQLQQVLTFDGIKPMVYATLGERDGLPYLVVRKVLPQNRNEAIRRVEDFYGASPLRVTYDHIYPNRGWTPTVASKRSSRAVRRRSRLAFAPQTVGELWENKFKDSFAKWTPSGEPEAVEELYQVPLDSVVGKMCARAINHATMLLSMAKDEQYVSPQLNKELKELTAYLCELWYFG